MRRVVWSCLLTFSALSAGCCWNPCNPCGYGPSYGGGYGCSPCSYGPCAPMGMDNSWMSWSDPYAGCVSDGGWGGNGFGGGPNRREMRRGQRQLNRSDRLYQRGMENLYGDDMGYGNGHPGYAMGDSMSHGMSFDGGMMHSHTPGGFCPTCQQNMPGMSAPMSTSPMMMSPSTMEMSPQMSPSMGGASWENKPVPSDYYNPSAVQPTPAGNAVQPPVEQMMFVPPRVGY